jgi:hypothetical protein
MPILIWYFPLIIMRGVCEIVLTEQEEQYQCLQRAATNLSRTSE